MGVVDGVREGDNPGVGETVLVVVTETLADVVEVADGDDDG